MTVSLENKAYEWANESMVKSWNEWDEGNIVASFAHTLPARVWYTADIIVNLIIVPFAVLAIVFGTTAAIATCDIKNPFFLKTANYLLERINHIGVSLIGVVSPGLGHRYKNASIDKHIAKVLSPAGEEEYNKLMENSFENKTYQFANKAVAKSWQAWEKGNYATCFGHTLPARFWYVADIIVNIVMLPVAIISVTFGFVLAVATCNFKNPFFLRTIHYILERTNHLCISAVGLLSPGLAHKYRDAKFPGKIVAAGELAAQAWMGYKFLTR